MSSPTYRFRVTIHARPHDANAGEAIHLGDTPFVPLDLESQDLGATFTINFEDAAEALSALPRMFVEPDGAFLWTPPDAWLSCQMEGVLYDRAGHLLYVDAHGECPAARFDQFLSALGWPSTPLMFQLVREAVFLDEREFRRHAEASGRLLPQRSNDVM